MTKQTDPNVIEQTVEFIEDARNCACCRHWCKAAISDIDHTAAWFLYCSFTGGPQWEGDEDDHPASPGRTSCNLWESDQLL